MTTSTSSDGPHPVDVHVGQRVSDKRRSLGYNQSELGRALGLTFQQVQKYERGANRMSASKLWDTAQFFKVDIAYFFEGLSGADDRIGSGPTTANDAEPSRASREIARLAKRLSVRQQRNLLAIL